MLHKPYFGGNMAMKIDIRKAFGTLDWNFILDVLEAFGFSFQFCDWILSLFSSARLSIMINGKIHEYFSYSRGVRQGDPLSPLLFCLVEDFLSRWIDFKVSIGLFQPMLYTRNTVFPTHFLYADDVLLFGKASLCNVRASSNTFTEYAKISSQLVNWSKSEAFYGSAISDKRVSKF